jgi:integrase
MAGYYGKVRRSAWWRAYLAFALETGERTGAILSLPRSAINFRTGSVVVPPALRKGRTKRGVYFLRTPVLELVKSVCREERVFAFPTKEAREIPGVFYHHFRRLLRIAGLPTTRKHLGQCLRRRHVNWLIVAAGIAVAQRSVGHSDSKVTRRYYEDPTKTQTTPPSSLLPKFFTGEIE